MREIKVIDSYDKMLKLKPVWNELLAKSDIDIPFMTFEWFSFWWRFFGNGRDMLTMAVYDDNKLIAIAPLMRKKTTWRGLPVTSISFAVDYYSGRTGVIIEPGKFDAVASIIEFLKTEKYAYDMLDIDFLPGESSTGVALGKLLDNPGFRYVKKPRILTPYIPVQGAWSDYLLTRSHNFKHKLSKTCNKYRRLPGYKIVKYTDASLAEALRQMEEISRASWKFREKTAIVNSDEKSRFFKELTEMLAASGWLNIWILTIADKPAAFAYNVRYKNRIYAMEIGYSDAHAQLSPSEFLNTEAIKECFDTGVTEYDWLGDALPFKMKWTSLTREHSKYWIFNNTVYGKLLYGVEQMCVMPVINLAHAIKGKFCGAAIVPEDITV